MEVNKKYTVKEVEKLIKADREKKEQDLKAKKDPSFKNLLIKYTERIKNTQNKPIIDLSDEILHNRYKNVLAEILSLHEPLNKAWDLQKDRQALNLLFAWFCNDKKEFEKYKLSENHDIKKDLFVCGVKGSGKSSTIFALNEMSTNFFPNSILSEKKRFKFIEQNKILNTFEIENNINKYTYNEQPGKFEGNPVNIILDDLKFEGLTKSFGSNFKDILIRFLYDRYSLWLLKQANTIITSLLTPVELKKHLPEDLFNRFQHQYNIVIFKGEKRGSN